MAFWVRFLDALCERDEEEEEEEEERGVLKSRANKRAKALALKMSRINSPEVKFLVSFFGTNTSNKLSTKMRRNRLN